MFFRATAKQLKLRHVDGLQTGAAVSKEEILVAIRECAEKIGHPPSLAELRINTGVVERHVRKHFLTYKRALAECGMVREGAGFKVSPEALFKDWAELVRSTGKLPTLAEYDMHSKYSHRPLISRFGSWRQVPMGLLGLAEENGWEVEWKDVVDVLRERWRDVGMSVKTCKRQRLTPAEMGIFTDRPTYGPPVLQMPLAHGPTNELGVVFLFGFLALKLGFVVTRIQPEFPDCEAMLEVQPGVWQRVRVEFEKESRNFVRHLHNVKDADVIVCWEHNWLECPLRVVELKKILQLEAEAALPKLLRESK
jgi:hypothetical protein